MRISHFKREPDDGRAEDDFEEEDLPTVYYIEKNPALIWKNWKYEGYMQQCLPKESGLSGSSSWSVVIVLEVQGIMPL